MRTDDRYRSRLKDLARSRADLIAARDVITAILADFDTISPPAGE